MWAMDKALLLTWFQLSYNNAVILVFLLVVSSYFIDEIDPERYGSLSSWLVAEPRLDPKASDAKVCPP